MEGAVSSACWSPTPDTVSLPCRTRLRQDPVQVQLLRCRGAGAWQLLGCWVAGQPRGTWAVLCAPPDIYSQGASEGSREQSPRCLAGPPSCRSQCCLPGAISEEGPEPLWGSVYIFPSG